MSPDAGAEAPAGDTDCYKLSSAPTSSGSSPDNCAALSRHAWGVNPGPTLFET